MSVLKSKVARRTNRKKKRLTARQAVLAWSVLGVLTVVIIVAANWGGTNNTVVGSANILKQFDRFQSAYSADETRLHSIIAGLSKGSIMAPTAYNDLQALATKIQQDQYNVTDVRFPTAYASVQSVMSDADMYLQSGVTDFENYVNKGMVSDMAAAQNDLQTAQGADQSVTLGVVKLAEGIK